MLQDLTEQLGYSGAVKNIGAFTRITVEDYRCRFMHARQAMEKRMNFKVGKIRQPDERRQIVDKNVPDVRQALFFPGHRNDLHPGRRKSRRVFLVKEITEDPIGEALECYWTIL